MLNAVKEVVNKYDNEASVEIINRKDGYIEIKVRSYNKYCDKAKIWISLHEMFKDMDKVIIEVL
ncbi:hypothetical protein BFU36_08100 [Sulfolobus sp. A20]|uniref:hypothetical protein n=1 Tax=Sulfolobaceae TaxID=118883 RepID=UPI0008461FD7|nr:MULTISPECIES: hypothetical protein [unclassified Sulfolobus]TRM74912.1 hypothetical protein DJ532_11625 [Sulfolobus sp. A20-N-F8]TRM76206.1 hypothetical protein DJ528_08580 [Sulfolobus sp. B5]TRM80953.1 hypothetical protein DJ524_05755 [Sulfolobus sp. D5]TRM82801.1 hypothetical protein DJ531_08340 [Sulfolobus sp. A20-N-F6]TRM86863.1 hypothetical protein DJ529_10150 [Sulfolobus sp. C3]TRM87584.1 hypothetical protein DJ521_03365 [Sulfolobus sp. E3]TRM93602.1 hypothetical protein DJ526_03575